MRAVVCVLDHVTPGPHPPPPPPFPGSIINECKLPMQENIGQLSAVLTPTGGYDFHAHKIRQIIAFLWLMEIVINECSRMLHILQELHVLLGSIALIYQISEQHQVILHNDTIEHMSS